MARLLSCALLVVVSSCGSDADPTAAIASAADDGADVVIRDPTDVEYVAWEGTAFTVIASDEADALFATTATCTNDVAGYSLTYPGSWYTNEPGAAPACSWFSPEPIDDLASDGGKDGTAIILRDFAGGIGQILEWPRILAEQVTIGGFEGHRTEDMVPGRPPAFYYGYTILLDADPDGAKIGAFTGTDRDGDYVLNKAVLDRIMAGLAFEEAP